MTDTPNPEKPTAADRIAKVIARAGVASRREAERMIVEGRVTVNGEKIASPALDVLPTDKIKVDGKPLEEPQETRLWMYYKPIGLVTSESDEKGRQTVFDALPRDLPRVMSIGRLDLNSEGLLLLTNDGELKRRLELPATGWLRRYRVRVNGNPTDLTFDPLRRGITIEGEDFQPMEVRLDSQQGANAWLTVGIREGRNREIRRAMSHVGMQVNRLIRIGYGPFKLTGMEENEVREVKRRTLRDQLGGLLTGETEDKPREFRERGARDERSARDDAPRERRKFGSRSDDARGEGAYGGARDGSRSRGARDDDRRPPRQARSAEGGDTGKPFRRREEGDAPRPFRSRDGERGEAARKTFGSGPRKDGAPRGKAGFGDDADRKPRWSGKPRGAESDGRADRGDRPYARRDGDSAGSRSSAGFKPRGEGFKPRGDGFKSRGEGFKPRSEGFKSHGEGSRSRGDEGSPRRDGFKPRGEGFKPRGEGFKSRGEGFKPRSEGFKSHGDGARSRSDDGGPRRDGHKPRGEGFKPRGEGFQSRGEGFKPRGEGGKSHGEGFKSGGPRKGGQPGGGKPFAGKGGRPGSKPGGFKPGAGKPRGPRG